MRKRVKKRGMEKRLIMRMVYTTANTRHESTRYRGRTWSRGVRTVF